MRVESNYEPRPSTRRLIETALLKSDSRARTSIQETSHGTYWAEDSPKGWRLVRQGVSDGDEQLVVRSEDFPANRSLAAWSVSINEPAAAVVLIHGDVHELWLLNTSSRASVLVQSDTGAREIAWLGSKLCYAVVRLERTEIVLQDVLRTQEMTTLRKLDGRVSFCFADGDWLAYSESTLSNDGPFFNLVNATTGMFYDRDAFPDLSVAVRKCPRAGQLVVASTADRKTFIFSKLQYGIDDVRNLRRTESRVPEIAGSLVGYFPQDSTILLVYRSQTRGFLAYLMDDAGTQTPLPIRGQLTSVIPAGEADSFWITTTDAGVACQLKVRVCNGAIEPGATWHSYVDHNSLVRRSYSVSVRDGTEVTVVIESLPGVDQAPTVLGVYGGFGVSNRIGGRPDMTAWALAGGAHGVIQVRGGGEKGPEWHLGAKRENKINAVTDAIDVCRWLVEQGVVSPSRLALAGASNGGLIASSAAILAPELFRACVVRHSVIDPFDPAPSQADAWREEYGELSLEKDREAVESYAPLRHIDVWERYPSFMIMYGTRDSIVNPRHSQRLIEALTNTVGADATRRIVRRPSMGGGHGPARNDRDWHLDRLCFLAEELGLGEPSHAS